MLKDKSVLRLGSCEGANFTSLWSLVGLRGWSTTLELKQGPSRFGQQWGILDNEQTFDPAILYEWRQLIGCKILSSKMIMTLFEKEVPANLVPAAAVKREGQALFGIIGRKGFVDGNVS